MGMIVLSDIHYGNIRIPAHDTYNSLCQVFEYLTPDIKILLLTGDIYDRVISFNRSDTLYIIQFFQELFDICSNNNIIIRIVKGTDDHDRRQLYVIDKLSKFFPNLNIKLFHEISIECIPEIGDILYMPDNLPFKDKYSIFEYIDKLLLSEGLVEVDYVAMHGQLDHMIPERISKPGSHVFKYEDFARICKKLVLCGHQHRPLLFKNILSVGSFNRLAHNEEEDKGFWKISDNGIKFIKNQKSTIFNTYNFTKYENIEDIITRYNEIVDSLPKDRKSFIRILIKDPHLRSVLIEYHNTLKINVELTFKSKTSIHEIKQKFDVEDISIELETPNELNLPTIIFNELRSNDILNISLDDIKSILE